jgi:alkanesulfonate monooxygenase SsuD/methylene tetrahydromethanopterin reductase-like flavin-dependent oxidoreductase (luciferase family)
MTSSMDSMIFAVLRQLARIRYRSVKAAFLFAIMTIALGAHASAATNEAEARALFTKFVAAQNAHSVGDVKSMLWNSRGTLLLARGIEIRGPAAVADRFKEYYEGTWHVEPDMSQFHVTSISKDVMQFVVPVVFTRGLPGQPSQDINSLITQTLVHDANGWHIASIISVANAQLK